eukprot:CAMPEP_0113448152 /NCGR_PEP_ID=MMETSP0014_2-20120614/4615_1 /TAXON_ID=2857 /ORGANISM="Nitzschia sp." /LENGTH=825 /DNA_ID=CAMNT_0000339347 /DNA_START=255 /DNA_END=2732 /DNA_ORIENTATION=- /assembly_acc=CAM_ASM_000159
MMSSGASVPSVATGYYHHHQQQHLNNNNNHHGDDVDDDVHIQSLDQLPDYLPSESQMVLLCLDYLRDLRRAYGSNPQDLLDAEGLHADWITLAIFALNQAFDGDKHKNKQHRRQQQRHHQHQQHSSCLMHPLLPVFNDAFMDTHKVLTESSPPIQRMMMEPKPSPNLSKMPTMEEMTSMILYRENPFHDQDDAEDHGAEKKQDSTDNVLDSYSWYEYDDSHPCNAHRLYLLNGLAGAVNGHRGAPITLGEVAAAGLYQLQAKSRKDAEDEMVDSPLFEQFVSAVSSKGFFQDPENATPRDNPQEEEERLRNKQAVHDDRMNKVVCKFRNKLAAKVDLNDPDVYGTTVLADHHHNRRMKKVIQSRKEYHHGGDNYHHQSMSQGPTTFSPALARIQPGGGLGLEAKAQEEAERSKSQGNAYMQQKDYESACDCYTHALRISPSGPQSHVYFSNRAAALLSLKKFDQAILDSERALALQPSYAKAHARLGLAHFLLSDYRNAMEAYTVALKYEPDNKSSKSYLEKAKKKVAAMNSQGAAAANTNDDIGEVQASFSVVSEWDKSRSHRNHHHRQNPQDNASQPSKSAATRTPITSVPGMANAHAEKNKSLGNSHMANREYKAAYDAYSAAIEVSPAGPQSHVYYSNRAAALCYLERYTEAAKDSETALRMKPTYGKAHARLGLSRFFLGDFEGSIEAYEAALSYDPNNAASKSYLAKARNKLEQQRQTELPPINVGDDARRLMEDPDMILMAKKAMHAQSDQELLQDPDLVKIARKATHDPTMLEAIQSIQSIQSVDFSTTGKQQDDIRQNYSSASSGGAGRVPPEAMH